MTGFVLAAIIVKIIYQSIRYTQPGVIRLQHTTQGFEEALLFNQSERTQVQVYETEITNLKEEIKTLAINCNLDIELNTTYSGILQQINNITTAQTVYYLRYTLEEDYFSTNETQ
ncbi:17792_t:CDS:2 [Gigaspora rosea]|nr:17792_t:CDS:2 [Gigaspora rosea]